MRREEIQTFINDVCAEIDQGIDENEVALRSGFKSRRDMKNAMGHVHSLGK